MKRVAKWFGIGVAGLLTLVVVLSSGFYARGRMVAGGEVETAGTPVSITSLTDSALLARGEHFVAHIAQCSGCHGAGLSGAEFINDGAFGVLPAPNLTSGRGGVGAAYEPAEWERAIRHGVAADGRPLYIMPSHMYQHMGDADMAAVIAVLESLPAVDNDMGERKIGPVLGLLTGLGQIKPAPRMIDHAVVGTVAPPAEGITAEYGDYLTRMASCRDCHGEALTGSTDGPAPTPSLIASAATWTFDQFRHAIREGKRPDGSDIDPTHMPWPGYAGMTDAELEAIHTYLKSRA